MIENSQGFEAEPALNPLSPEEANDLRLVCIELFREAVDNGAARLHKALIKGYPASYRLDVVGSPSSGGAIHVYIPRAAYKRGDAPFMVRNYMSSNQQRTTTHPWSLVLEDGEGWIEAPAEVDPQMVMDTFKEVTGEFIESHMRVGKRELEDSAWELPADR